MSFDTQAPLGNEEQQEDAALPESQASGFDNLGLAAEIVRSVKEAGYIEPTEVQAQAIPAAISGVDLLVSSGVRLSVWSMPAELEESRSGDPITYDDLLEFHYQLQQDGWFDRLINSVRSPDEA